MERRQEIESEKKSKRIFEMEENKLRKIEKIQRKKQERESRKIEENIEFYKRKNIEIDEKALSENENILYPFIEKVFGLDLNKQCLQLLESKIFRTFEKYSEQEIDALLSDEDFILLGRSGTGKTMVALTKMFLIKMCANLKECKCLIKDLLSTLAVRVIFCATSSNLVDEAFNYYSIIEKKFMEVMKIDHNPIPKFNLQAFDLIEVVIQ